MYEAELVQIGLGRKVKKAKVIFPNIESGCSVLRLRLWITPFTILRIAEELFYIGYLKHLFIHRISINICAIFLCLIQI